MTSHRQNGGSSSECLVIYVGPSLNNCPRLKLVSEALRDLGHDPLIVAITKNSTGCNLPYRNIEYSYGSRPIIAKLFVIFILFLRLTAHVIKARPATLYCINPLAGLIGVLCQTVWGTTFTYETQELFCGVSYKGLNSFLLRILIFVDMTSARRSSLFITTDQFRKTFLRRLYKLGDQPQLYIYNVSKQTEPILEEQDSVIAEARSQFVKLVLYAGGVSADRGIKEIIEIARRLQGREYGFIIAGANDGSISETYFETAGLDNVIRIKNPTHNQIKWLSDHVDVSLAFYKPNKLNNRFASPNKLFDALASGIPIITSKSYLSKYLALHTDLCFNVAWTSSDDLVNGVVETLRSIRLSAERRPAKKFSYIDQKRQLSNALALL